MTRKILLVDDSLHDAEFTLHALKHCKINNPVVYAEDGRVALTQLANDPDIALVLLDLKMRIVDGYEFLKIVRADPTFVHVPIVIVTGSNLLADRARVEVLGASSYVVKEFDLQSFSDSLCRALEPFLPMLDDEPAPV